MPWYKESLNWVEEHPIGASVIGVGGAVVVLWYFGFFSSSGSSGGGTDLTSALYQAEAAQAQVGGQIQLANINAASQAQLAGIAASAEEAIATTQAGAAVTVNAQNAGVSIAGANDALLAAQTNSDNALAAALSNNATSVTIADTAAAAAEQSKLLGSIVSLETINKGSPLKITGLPGTTGSVVIDRPSFLTVNQAKSMGFTSKQYAALTGLPGWK